MRTSPLAGGLVALAATSVLAGCGNFVTTDVRGIVGLTADASGRPVAVVAACGADLDQVSVVELLDRTTVSQETRNPVLVELTASAPPGERFEVSLTSPGSAWSVTGHFDPESQSAVVVNAASTRRDQVATPVQVSRAAYASVNADRVMVREGESWTRAEFDARACRPDTWPSVAGS